jgi:protein-L-isoaspartate O-methyltransferase
MVSELYNQLLKNNSIALQKVGRTGMAVGIDHIDQLVNQSIENVRKDPALAALLDAGQMKLVVGDGRQGYEELGPYDAIHVGAAAPQVPTAVRKVNQHLMWMFLALVLAAH